MESAEKLLERIREDGKVEKISKKQKQNSRPESSKQNKNLPTSWLVVPLQELCCSSFYGPRFSKDKYVSDGIPSIRTTDMTKFGEIVLSESTPTIKIHNDKLESFKVIKNDLLVTRSGSVGMMAIFKDDYVAMPSAYLIRFRFTSLFSVD